MWPFLCTLYSISSLSPSFIGKGKLKQKKTYILRDRIADVHAQTEIRNGRLEVTPFGNGYAFLEQHESLSIQELPAHSSQVAF